VIEAMKLPEGSKPEESRIQGSLSGLSRHAHNCTDSPQLILRALDGIPNPQIIQSVRDSFGSCLQCNNALDLEIRFKLAMSQQETVKAPPSLQLKISESLQRIDLGDISVNDL
tara:strand:- start:244 stop:582 length:339 start_codon:yes stop_codon:yes gene_type:complete